MLIPCVLAVYLPKARPFRGPQILQARPGSDERLDFMRLSIYGLVYDRNISSIVITSYMILSFLPHLVDFGLFTMNQWGILWDIDSSLTNQNIMRIYLLEYHLMLIMEYWFIMNQPKNVGIYLCWDIWDTDQYGLRINQPKLEYWC